VRALFRLLRWKFLRIGVAATVAYHFVWGLPI